MKTFLTIGLYFPRTIFAACAIFCILGIVNSANAAPSGAQNSLSAVKITSEFAIADYDGDNRPDFASVHAAKTISGDTRYSIAFQLSSGSSQTLGIVAPTGGVQITARDVNGDEFVDVIVATEWTNIPVAVLLNDGNGNFTLSSPADFPNVFLASETSLTLTSPEIKDVFALVFTRYFTKGCYDGRSGCPLVNTTKLRAVGASDRSPDAPTTSFAGRAPPFFIPYL